MYENLTYERIMSRVLANVPSNVDKRQGSVIYDAVAPVCSEIAQIYVALDNCLNESFADTAQRDYLVLRAKEIGLEPKKHRRPAAGHRRQIPFHTVICGLRKEKTDKNI